MKVLHTMKKRGFLWGNRQKDSVNIVEKNVQEQGMQIEYDYGSTTELIIRVQDYYYTSNQKEKITILSRNNPPRFVCSVCEKNTAKWINPQGFYDDILFLCEDCLEESEEELDFDCLLQVCNSPRMGACGYEGSKCYPDQFEPDKIL